MISASQTALRAWSALSGLDLSLCLAALFYLRGWLPLHRAFPRLISAWRAAAFLAGITFIWVAIGSPMEAFDGVSLTIHMVQHLLLMIVAPPLILLGAPALPILRGLPQSIARHIAGPMLRSGPLKWLGHVATNPAICWFAASLVLIGWHVPTVFELALRSTWLHELEHATFFGTGLVFWGPVIQPWPSTARWPRWSIPLYLFCATFPCDVLSAFLAFCDRVVYPSYLSTSAVFGLSPLQDQECAAALMWTCVTVIFLIPAVLVTLEILSPRKAHLREETRANLRLSGRPVQSAKLEVV